MSSRTFMAHECPFAHALFADIEELSHTSDTLPIPPIPWVHRHRKPTHDKATPERPEKKRSWEPFLVDFAATLQKLPDHEELLSGFGEDARQGKPQETDPNMKQMTAAGRRGQHFHVRKQRP